PRQEARRDRDYLTPLPGRHGGRRAAKTPRVPCFHLDEHEAVVLDGDDVDFARWNAVPAGNNFVPGAFERRGGEIFAAFSAFQVRAGHGSALVQSPGRPALP